MTLDSLAQVMATEFGEQYGDLDIADQFRDWTQEVFEEVVGDARWFFKNGSTDIVPVLGQAVYTLPVGVAEVRTAYIPTTPKPARVAYSSVERLLARGANLGEPGTPRAWHYCGIDSTTTAQKVRLWPVPDAAFLATGLHVVLETVNRPEALLTTDTIPLPPEYIRVMRDGIRFKVKFNDGDLEGASLAHQRFSSGLDRLNMRFNGQEQQGSNLRVKKIKANRAEPRVV
jgi:hypothetical protein